MERVKEWVKSNHGYGSGSGSGNGCGYGDGYGSGYGDGSGDGSGSGSGSGSCNGCGYGDGSGYDYGDGSGCGYGDGHEVNGDYIYNIDRVNTIIKSIKGKIAKGFIVNNDLSLTKTYVVKDFASKYFAHGKTIKEAFLSLEKKMIAYLDVDERIEMFLKDVDKCKKYPLQYFFEWHGKLTGSCLQGRENFICNKRLTLEDEINFDGFMKLCENQYGWEVIKKLI